jgi:bacillopeptidase F
MRKAGLWAWLGGAWCLSCSAGALDPPSAAGVAGDAPQRVLIKFHGEPPAPGEIAGRRELVAGLRARAHTSQQQAVAVLRAAGVEPVASLWMTNALVVEASAETLERLGQLKDIKSIVRDREVLAPTVSVRWPGAAPSWNLGMIRAPEMWALGYKGQGTVVAILDTGVDASHPSLSGAYGGKWFDPYGENALPSDKNGHGTQVAGLVAGGALQASPVGVAPNAKWIAAKVFNNAGKGTLSAMHQAFQWALDPDGDPTTDDAADVVNASWGFADEANQCVAAFEQDLALLRQAGVFVVFAAGNSGPGALSSVSPANYPEAFAVGGVDAEGAAAFSASRGPGACDGKLYPNIVAPGIGVRTTDLSFGGLVTGAAVVVSGTSFAAPHVSGAIALLRSAWPDASVELLEQALQATSADMGDAGPDGTHGHGLLDVMSARAWLGLNEAFAAGRFPKPAAGLP